MHGHTLTLSIPQGEHTKDAVYIDAERRFQELEKVLNQFDAPGATIDAYVVV